MKPNMRRTVLYVPGDSEKMLGRAALIRIRFAESGGRSRITRKDALARTWPQHWSRLISAAGKSWSDQQPSYRYGKAGFG